MSNGERRALAELDCFHSALNRLAIVSYSDRAGRITHVNDLFCEISGYDRAELIGSPHSIINSGHHPREFFQEMWRTIATGERWHGEVCNKAKNGTLYWVDTTVVALRGTNEQRSGYISIRYDITQRKLAEQALGEEMQRRKDAEVLLRDIIEAIPSGVAAFDKEDTLVLFNSAFKDCYPRAADAIVEGVPFEAILRRSLEGGEFEGVRGDDRTRQEWLAERLRRHRDPGRPFMQHLSDDRWLKVEERFSQSGHIVGVRTDVSDLKRAERKIKIQAGTDPLTGLANRRVLLERLDRALEARRERERSAALLLLDLDGFKLVNDTLGHDAGDKLLIEVARRLEGAVRKSDLVARLGGDEFAVLVHGVGSVSQLERVARRILSAFQQPMRIERKWQEIACSVGAALFPVRGRNSANIFKHADLALYRAKREKGSACRVFEPEMLVEARRRSAMSKALRGAVARGGIQVALQPQQCFLTGAHSGFEALARWQRDGRWISPAHFIALAEETGLINELGARVIAGTLAAMRDLRASGLAPGRVAINVAAAQLRDQSFAPNLIADIARHQLATTDVTVEVTESVILEKDGAAIGQTLSQLTDEGITIALDDFGTGYASLSHLKRFPISCLKIDKSFVAELTSGQDDTVIAGTIISLAHSLGLTVVAEGIETQEQYNLLREMNCDVAQGYLIGRPLLAGDVKEYLRSKNEEAGLHLRVA